MIICSHCGGQNDSRTIFCSHCHSYIKRADRGVRDQKISQTPPREIGNPAGYLNVDVDQSGSLESQPSNPAARDSADDSAYVEAFDAEEPLATQATEQRTSFSNYFIVLALSVFLAGGIYLANLYFFSGTEAARADRDASEIYAEAEQLFNTHRYSEALVKFQQFVRNYPDNPLVFVAEEKINSISSDLLTQEQRNTRIASLLIKAEAAFSQQRFLTPENDNVITYTKQILALDDLHPRALEIEEDVKNFYSEKATVFLARKKYSPAIEYYNKVLMISPEDPLARQLVIDAEKAMQNEMELSDQLRRERSRRQQSETVARIAEQRQQRAQQGEAAARQELANSKILASRTQAELEQQLSRATSTSGSIPLSESTSGPQAGPDGEQSPATDASNEKATDSGAASVTKPALVDKASPTEVLAVDAAYLDKGIPRAVYLSKPVVPRSWDFGGFSTVVAECLVGTDGRVEEVTIITAGKDKRLDDLTVDAFKTDLYGASTYQGKPVKFRIRRTVNYSVHRR